MAGNSWWQAPSGGKRQGHSTVQQQFAFNFPAPGSQDTWKPWQAAAQNTPVPQPGTSSTHERQSDRDAAVRAPAQPVSIRPRRTKQEDSAPSGKPVSNSSSGQTSGSNSKGSSSQPSRSEQIGATASDRAAGSSSSEETPSPAANRKARRAHLQWQADPASNLAPQVCITVLPSSSLRPVPCDT